MATTMSRRLVRSTTRWTLSIVGFALLGVLMLFARSYTESVRVFVGTLVFPLASIAILTGLGYYIARHSPTVEAMRTILAWTGLGLLVMVVVVGWYQVLDVIHHHDIPLVILGLTTLCIGGAMGALVGWYSVRAKNNVEKAARAHSRKTHLEQQRETMALLDRTLRHHLLNALTIVDGRARILEDHVDDEGIEHLRTVQDQSEEMIATIEQIRDVSEVLYEQDEIERIDLVETVRSEVSSAEQSYPDAAFETDDLPDRLPVDANRLLANVVSNLLHNAVQHNDSPTPRVGIEVRDTGETAAVSVTDNGPGLPDDDAEQLFEMGERGPDSDGNGMGLFLARTVIERLDGRIWFEDDDSSGSTIAFEIPTQADSL